MYFTQTKKVKEASIVHLLFICITKPQVNLGRPLNSLGFGLNLAGAIYRSTRALLELVRVRPTVGCGPVCPRQACLFSFSPVFSVSVSIFCFCFFFPF
jgi:hypothetical protein